MRPTPSGIGVEFEYGTSDEMERERLQGVLDARKAERVVNAARDLGLLMRWVCRRLDSVKGEVGS